MGARTRTARRWSSIRPRGTCLDGTCRSTRRCHSISCVRRRPPAPAHQRRIHIALGEIYGQFRLSFPNPFLNFKTQLTQGARRSDLLTEPKSRVTAQRDICFPHESADRSAKSAKPSRARVGAFQRIVEGLGQGCSRIFPESYHAGCALTWVEGAT